MRRGRPESLDAAIARATPNLLHDVPESSRIADNYGYRAQILSGREHQIPIWCSQFLGSSS